MLSGSCFLQVHFNGPLGDDAFLTQSINDSKTKNVEVF